MPRAVLKVQGAPDKTRWTLAQNNNSKGYSPKVLEVQRDSNKMPPMANGGYFEGTSPSYDAYDGMSPISQHRSNSLGWKPSPSQVSHLRGASGEDVMYSTPLEERESYKISMKPRAPSQQQDALGRHLLYETALLDSQNFDILAIEEVDALKKEHARLNSRIESAQRKLALETKVKDAAQNLQRLYSTGSGNRSARADTPQSPDSPRRSRKSLLGRERSSSNLSNGSQSLQQAGDELAQSIKKVDELTESMKDLQERRQYVERKLLRHTAAVLAEQREKDAQNGAANGRRQIDEDDAASAYSPDEFDGIRDILAGRNGGKKLQKNVATRKLQEEHEEQLYSMQTRIEQLNQQLRDVIGEASRARGQSPEPEHNFGSDANDDLAKRVESGLDRMESNLRVLEQEHQDTRTHNARIQDGQHHTRNAVEGQLEALNTQLHNTLMLSPAARSLLELQPPPDMAGHGYQSQLEYLEESLLNIEQLLRNHSDELDAARESNSGSSRELEEVQNKAASHAQKLDEYDATLGGLWEILQSEDGPMRRNSNIDDHMAPPPSPMIKESFSLQAFNSRVQHLFDRATSAKEQQDILRRQVQQQRELNGKSDAEKDRQISELQSSHENLTASHGQLQEDLTKAIAYHTQSETEASSLRAELLNVENELDQFRRTTDTRQQEREQMAGQLQVHQANAEGMQERIHELEAQLLNVENELDQFRRTTDTRQQEREQMAGQLQVHQANAEGMQERIHELEAQADELKAQITDLTDDHRILNVESEAKMQDANAKHAQLTSQLDEATAAREAAEQKHVAVNGDLQNLESEVVRLTTELTMAKAELDGAYGSRAERAKEAQVAELSTLNERNADIARELETLRSEHATLREEHTSLRTEHGNLLNEHGNLRNEHTSLQSEASTLRASSQDTSRTADLERELTDMTAEYQELTKASLELEKERTQLDALIDDLRDRCELLEGQLSDEKVRWMGVRSPTGGARESMMVRDGREMTSTMVLRQEFKKMMRETRAEGVRLLRAEQDERKKIEAELRRLRQAHSPLNTPGLGVNRISTA